MTNVALLRRRNVAGTLARGDDTVVTAGAGANHLRMIHRAVSHRYPLGRRHRMARFTHIGSTDMRCALATGVSAIVTADTVAGDTTMIDRRP